MEAAALFPRDVPNSCLEAYVDRLGETLWSKDPAPESTDDSKSQPKGGHPTGSAGANEASDHDDADASTPAPTSTDSCS